MAGDRHSRTGKAFANAVLIARQRPVGKDDPGADAEGRVERHLPNSIPQRLNLRHQEV